MTLKSTEEDLGMFMGPSDRMLSPLGWDISLVMRWQPSWEELLYVRGKQLKMPSKHGTPEFAYSGGGGVGVGSWSFILHHILECRCIHGSRFMNGLNYIAH